MNIIKKTALVLITLSVGSLAFAANDKRVAELEKQMKEITAKNAMGNMGITTAPASPLVVDGTGFFITGGPIYQHARVGGTEFAYTDDDPAASLPIHGRVKEIDFNWDWGLRVGVGYNFEHDNWDVNLNYTWLDSSGSKTVTSGLNSTVVPLRAAAVVSSPCWNDFKYATIAKSQFDVDFNIINLELGRAYFISSHLALRPHFGLQSTWIDLQQVSRYSGPDLDSILQEFGGLGIHTVSVNDESDFWGIGPRAGLDSKWYFGCNGFNIFGNVSGALLYGRSDVDHREKFSFCPEEGRISLDANRHHFVPTAQMQLGLGWDKYYNNDKVHIGFRIGYDAQYFWRANQMLRLDDPRPKYHHFSEDVSMHGLMLDAKISF